MGIILCEKPVPKNKRITSSHKHCSRRVSKRQNTKQYRCNSIYDISTKIHTKFELECYSNCSKEELRAFALNMYNVTLNIQGFEYPNWQDHNTIFDVIKHIYTKTRKNGSWNDSGDTYYRYKTLNTDEQYLGIAIKWVYNIEDDELRSFGINALKYLVSNINYPTYRWDCECHIEYLFTRIEEAQSCIDDVNYDYDKQELLLDIKYWSSIIDEYQKVIPILDDLEVSNFDLDIFKKEFISIRDKYRHKGINDYLSFFYHVLKLSLMEINFNDYVYNNLDTYSGAANVNLIWTRNDDFFEEYGQIYDECIGNNGLNSLYYKEMITKDEIISNYKNIKVHILNMFNISKEIDNGNTSIKFIG